MSDVTRRGCDDASPTTIDRVDELRRLHRAVIEVEGQRGCIVLIEGEAGIGKSHLIRALQSHASQRGWSVSVGTQNPVHGHRPFGVLAEGLGQVTTAPVIRAEPAASPERTDPASATMEAYIAEMVRRSAERPLLLVVENGHWADVDSLSTLLRATDVVADHAAMIVISARPSPMPDALAHLRSVTTERGWPLLNLGPLDDSSLMQLAGEILGSPPGERLRDRLRVTGGNPLYTIELIRGLTRSGSIVTADAIAELVHTAPPLAAELTILDNLRVVPRETRDLLRTASILGRSFTPADLSLLTHRSAVELAAVLAPAFDARVLDGGSVTISFRHDVIWELFYYDTNDAMRAALHKEVAQAFARAGRSADLIASHLLRGVHEPDQQGLELIVTTAAGMRSQSPETTVTLAEHGLSIAGDQHPLVPALRAVHALGLIGAGRHEDGQLMCRHALCTGAPAEYRSDLRRALTGSLMMAGQVRDVINFCERTLESPAIDDRERTYLQSSLAFSTLHAGRALEAHGVAEAATDLAEHLGDPVAIATARVANAHALSQLGRFRASVDAAVGAVTALDGHQPVLHMGHVTAASRMNVLDRFDEADSMLEDGRRLYEHLGAPAALAQHHVAAGSAHFDCGNWDAAQGETEATADLAAPGLAWPVLSHGRLALIAAHRDQRATAQDHVDAAMAALAQGASPLMLDLVARARMILAEPEHGTGAPNIDELREQVQVAWAVLTAASESISSPGSVVDIARRMHQVGDSDGLEDVATRMRICEGHNPGSPSIEGAARFAAGLADDDLDLLRAAIACHRRTRRPLQLAICCEVTADELVDRGRIDEGEALRSEALDVYAALGARRDVRRIERVRASQRPRRDVLGGVGAPASGPIALTPAEHKVAELLRDRLSNQEIADRLFVSRRTVESHVSRILAKLGVKSRREVALYNCDSSSVDPTRGGPVRPGPLDADRAATGHDRSGRHAGRRPHS